MTDTTHAPATEPTFIWTDPAEEAVYHRTVEACLIDPRIARRLESRPGVTADGVRAAMTTDANITRALLPCLDTRAKYRAAADKLEAARSALAQARADVEFDVRSVLVWGLAVLMGAVAIVGPRYSSPSFWPAAIALGVLGVILGLLLAWTLSSERSEENLENQFELLENLLALKPREVSARIELKRWKNDLRQNGTHPVVLLVIEALLGDDPHSVLQPDNYEGLRAAQGSGYVVPSSATRELERKLSILEGGTIAVCGPRGSGKTTLLAHAVAEGDFKVSAHVPATYTPHDFLLSLFSDVCEEYIKRAGFEPPAFTRLSGLVRGLRKVRRALRTFRRRIFFALPAAALIVLGSFATARSLWLTYDDTIHSGVNAVTRWTTHHVLDIWQGNNLGAGLLITLAGLFVWQVRRSARWRRHLRTLPRTFLRALALCLIAAAFISIPMDAELRRHTETLLEQGSPFLLAELLLLIAFPALLLTGYVMKNVRLGKRTFPARRLFSPAALCCLAGFVELFRRNDEAVAMFLDQDNPTRLLCFTVGMLPLSIARRAKGREPALVTRCRDQLYHLKTVQTTSAAVTPGASQIAALAGTHTSALATIPSKFPELVGEFRELLAHIAEQVLEEGHRTMIALDELDRLGSDVQARAFLSEIKAILGVPHVYYLISVAEDVGAAFVRRGLPHRDATDSSLDDIVHVQPCDLDESRALMDRRAPGLTPPYVLLAHALSGGIPRDLIRYGRRIMEMRERTSSLELTDISRRLILEELSDTLAGYRTLLAKQQWTAENAGMLNNYRELTAQLRAACVCHTDTVTRTLERFSAQPAPGATPSAPLPEDIAHLCHEASVYAYYALTLLQIFSAPAFDQRSSQAEVNGPAGDPQCLAEARLELTVSSYSARPLVSDVRRAWSLPPVTALALTATIPAPRLRPCPLHPEP
ncbi:hypothetical protein [Streptomyces pratensis]|uniref:hypothetical protein n=1 Tax=Streptomyces pratensis TaxID=1169025 RepID=UPI00362DE44F